MEGFIPLKELISLAEIIKLNKSLTKISFIINPGEGIKNIAESLVYNNTIRYFKLSFGEKRILKKVMIRLNDDKQVKITFDNISDFDYETFFTYYLKKNDNFVDLKLIDHNMWKMKET